MSTNRIQEVKPGLLSGLFFYLLVSAFLLMSSSVRADANLQQPATSPKSQAQAQTVGTVSGTYIGTIAISEPASLGVMDLAVDLSTVEGGLSGTIDSTQTQAFPGSTAFSGSITSVTDAITPTFTISGAFDSVTAGRTITRTVTLEGDVLDQGDTLRGIYSEHIEGFTRKPLNVRGSFLLIRSVSPAAEDK